MTIDELEALEVGCVNSHFLDSGSFTLWTKAAKWAKEHGKSQWDFYDTKEFWKYVDDYAAFVKKYSYGIDLFANIDAIPNPDITWRNQQYLEEKHGLRPVPVVHYKTDLKWLKHYMERDYPVIALGGLVGSTSQDACQGWIDRAFSIVCDQPSRLPLVRIHGFGVTNYDLMLRYPWWSVDSTSWTKVGAYGGIMVPHLRRGKWVFITHDPRLIPYVVKVSNDSPDKKLKGKHYLNMSETEKAIVRKWLDEIEIPLGSFEDDGETIKEMGVVTRHTERRAANLLFFERLRMELPEYPWPFRTAKRKGFGVAQ